MPDLEPVKKVVSEGELKRLAKILDLYVLKGGVNPQELLSKISSLEYLVFPDGAEIVREGTQGKDLYIISRGSALVSRDGREIARLSPGDLFGEVAFLSGTPLARNATVSAGEGCEVYRLESGGFDEILSNHPNLRDSMISLAKARTKKQSA